VVTTDWATIGARNANGDFQIIAIGKSDTIYALSSYNSVYKITPAGAVTTNWLTSSDISSGSSVDMTAISVNKPQGMFICYTQNQVTTGSLKSRRVKPLQKVGQRLLLQVA